MPDPINAETFIPDLLVDFLESRRTALDMPTSDDLPFYPGIRDGLRAEPCVVVYCDAWESPHPHRMVLNVSVTLLNARDEQESADESANAAKIRRALCDLDVFNTWLAALPSGDREGWDIRKYAVIRGGIEIDPELSQRRRFTILSLHVITTEMVEPSA